MMFYYYYNNYRLMLLLVCFQAAGSHVERCIVGFNVPRSQH